MRALDALVVGALCLASVAYVMCAVGPAVLRQWLKRGAAAVLLRLPRVLGLRPLGQRLGAVEPASGRGACGGCSSCGAAPSAPRRPVKFR